MEEALLGRHVQVIEGASDAGVYVGIEDRGDFRRSEVLGFHDREGEEVDGDAVFDEGDVAGDGTGCGTGGGPIAFVLGGAGEGTNEKEKNGYQCGARMHSVRMRYRCGRCNRRRV